MQDLIAEKEEKISLDDVYHEPKGGETPLEAKLAMTKFKLALEYLKQNQKESALSELDDAFRYDPDNYLIRKQRWYIRHPEKFTPTIDLTWQQQQLEIERADELADCGPDGCKIPGTD
ncbi:hypothetical protein [Salisediminibacterium beveridgei]|uniref:hypothetical protein n=1 Tax=Salisediminibacterium beveridgei TaxID=632773 RepID=UPI001E50C598|nr:hypothetical protein [Salisediminibacterium beveridgei]